MWQARSDNREDEDIDLGASPKRCAGKKKVVREVAFNRNVPVTEV